MNFSTAFQHVSTLSDELAVAAQKLPEDEREQLKERINALNCAMVALGLMEGKEDDVATVYNQSTH